MAPEKTLATIQAEADNEPCEHCGTTKKPRSFDRWDNWLCDEC